MERESPSNKYIPINKIQPINEIIQLLSSSRLISESPRWLLTKKRRQAAEKIMRKIAEMNGKELTEETYSRVKDDVMFLV